MPKLNREALAHYIDTTFQRKIDSADWEIIGDDIEEMSVEMNSDMETTKNILGQTKTKDNGYEPTMDADPFYADPDKKLYKPLRDIALERKKGADCQTLMLEVIVEDTDAENHLAFVQEVLVKPNSYGGGTEGVNIPFTVSEDGERTKGYVSADSIKSGKPVFTKGDLPATMSLSGKGAAVETTSSKSSTGKSLS